MHKSASTRYASANERTVACQRLIARFPHKFRHISLSYRKRVSSENSIEHESSALYTRDAFMHTRGYSIICNGKVTLLFAGGDLPSASILEFRAYVLQLQAHKETLICSVSTLNYISIINRTHELTNQFLLQRK